MLRSLFAGRDAKAPEGRSIVSETDDFVNEQNIKNFAQKLSSETNNRTRRTLSKLLLEEEERLGLRTWHLKLVDQHISDTTSRIDNQKSLIHKSSTDGGEASVAEAFLKTLNVVRQTYEAFRPIFCMAWTVAAYSAVVTARGLLMHRLDLTDGERAILISALRRLIDLDPQSVSAHIQEAKAILERLEPKTPQAIPDTAGTG
jgi:hypothetical protein